MTPQFDLVIRAGTVVDGTGGPAFEADIAVSNGRIVEVGRVTGRGREEIDARGLLVTPGFVDIHSHYDGQATWSHRLDPSSDQGVTTTMMGNCGVGFAPCLPENRDRLIKLMEGVEDIPQPVMVEGLPWNWETFPDYMNALAARDYDMDVAVQLPHAPVRVHVMGQRGADCEPATQADIAAMGVIVREAIGAGALGFSTSRTYVHQTRDGKATPSYRAGEDELTEIAKALRTAGGGHVQLVCDFMESEADAEFEMLRRIVTTSGQPLIFTLSQQHRSPLLWRRLLDKTDDANGQGVPLTAMISGRPVGMLMGFGLTQNPFTLCPSYDAVATLAPDARIATLRTPEVRARLLAEAAVPRAPRHPMEKVLSLFGQMFPLGDPPDYAPAPENSLAAQGAREGRPPAEVAYDAMLAQNGGALLYVPGTNFADGTLDAVADMLERPNTVLGLADGGAHCGMICDASMTTYLLTYWTRDRAGPKLSLPRAVQILTSDGARTVGLNDRGVIARGYKADINLIAYDRLRIHAPEIRYDLPANGRRLHQRAEGYVATILSGEIVSRDGGPTGALPGRLIRGRKSVA